MIYLDANSTTPILPEVLEQMMRWMVDGYANPNGVHRAAREARAAIEQARAQVAGMIGAEADEIVFTSGGTEGANTVLRSLDGMAGHGPCVTSAIEHSCVLRSLEGLGRESKQVGVDRNGVLDLSAYELALEGSEWVAVMAANNETGVIQPLAEVSRMAKERGKWVYSDAVQAAGRVVLDVKELGCDFLSLSAHKFHGPKGVGAIYIRRGMPLKPLLYGGGQERGYRSGTENTAAIVGMGVAAEMATRYLADGRARELEQMRDAFEQTIQAGLTGVVINGKGGARLANTSHVSFEGCDAAGLLILMDEMGVACSAGSACMTGKQKPSHVQMAMGIPEGMAKSSLRFSLSRLNTMDEVVDAAGLVIRAVEKLRRVQGVGVGPVVVYSP